MIHSLILYSLKIFIKWINDGIIQLEYINLFLNMAIRNIDVLILITLWNIQYGWLFILLTSYWIIFLFVFCHLLIEFLVFIYVDAEATLDEEGGLGVLNLIDFCQWDSYMH